QVKRPRRSPACSSLSWTNGNEQQKEQICRQEEQQGIAERIAGQLENIIAEPRDQRGVKKQKSNPKERHRPPPPGQQLPPSCRIKTANLRRHHTTDSGYAGLRIGNLAGVMVTAPPSRTKLQGYCLDRCPGPDVGAVSVGKPTAGVASPFAP